MFADNSVRDDMMMMMMTTNTMAAATASGSAVTATATATNSFPATAAATATAQYFGEATNVDRATTAATAFVKRFLSHDNEEDDTEDDDSEDHEADHSRGHHTAVVRQAATVTQARWKVIAPEDVQGCCAGCRNRLCVSGCGAVECACGRKYCRARVASSVVVCSKMRREFIRSGNFCHCQLVQTATGCPCQACSKRAARKRDRVQQQQQQQQQDDQVFAAPAARVRRVARVTRPSAAAVAAAASAAAMVDRTTIAPVAMPPVAAVVMDAAPVFAAAAAPLSSLRLRVFLAGNPESGRIVVARPDLSFAALLQLIRYRLDVPDVLDMSLYTADGMFQFQSVGELRDDDVVSVQLHAHTPVMETDMKMSEAAKGCCAAPLFDDELFCPTELAPFLEEVATFADANNFEATTADELLACALHGEDIDSYLYSSRQPPDPASRLPCVRLTAFFAGGVRRVVTIARASSSRSRATSTRPTARRFF